MKAIDRYMVRLIALPLVGTLTVAAMLLLLEKMLRLFDFVAAEGGPVRVVWKMLANLIPEYMSLGIPIGLALGILLAFRRLAMSSELDILRAVGIGYPRLLRVPYMFPLGLALLNFAIVSYITPYARYFYEELRFELRSGALGASIDVGEFNRLGDGFTLRIEKSEERGRKLSDLFVRLETGSGQEISASAERGQFLRTDDPNTILLRLENGALIHDGPSFANPRVLSFTVHDLPINLPEIGMFRERGDGWQEVTLAELWRIGGDSSESEKTRLEARGAFHYRVAEIAMMFLIPLLAVALAVPPKRSSSALGVMLSVVFLVTYHKINQYGEGVAGLGKVDPIILLWGPFVVAAAIILWMFYIAAFVPGGQPIGALEKAFAKTGGALKKLLRLFRPRLRRSRRREITA